MGGFEEGGEFVGVADDYLSQLGLQFERGGRTSCACISCF